MYTILDLETVPCPMVPAKPRDDGKDVCPAAPHHKVRGFGLLALGRNLEPQKLRAEASDDEGRLLSVLADVVQSNTTIVTWNGRGFDVPVLIARMMRHGIEWPRFWNGRDMRYRYSPSGHLDLMDQLCDYGAGMRWSLDAAGQLVGFSGKTGDGRAVGSMADDEIRSYVACDVAITAAVFVRWLRHTDWETGRFKTDWHAATASLVELVDDETLLEPLRERIDRDVFVLPREEAVAC